MLDDDVAAEHPNLDVPLAHPAFPLEKQQLAICQQKRTVYRDRSGWLPRYIDDQVLQSADTILQDKVMFGTDYPLIEPDEWLADLAEHTDYPPAVQGKLLWKTAEA